MYRVLHQLPRTYFWYLLTFGILMLPGCGAGEAGPEIVPVTGNVTYDGKPVKSGQIHFANEEQGYIFPAMVEQGISRVSSQFGDGIPLGAYKIKLTPLPPKPLENRSSPTELPPPPVAPDIPEIYRDFSSSGFTVEVRQGMSPVELAMKPQ